MSYPPSNEDLKRFRKLIECYLKDISCRKDSNTEEGIGEAPTDGNIYGRINRSWKKVPGYLVYDDIQDMIVHQPDQRLIDLFFVIDASEDSSITFKEDETHLQAVYILKRNELTGSLEDYEVFATPYGNSGGKNEEDKVELIQDYETIGTIAGETQKEYNERNQAIIEALIGNVPHPNYLSPTMTISPESSVRKVGGNYNVNVSLSYTQRDGGAITAEKIEKNGIEVSTTDTFSETLLVPIGLTTYKGTISYAQGPVKNNNIGIPDPVGRVPAGTLIKNTTVEGVYPLFGTTSSITVGTEQQPLVSMQNANNVVLNLVAESGGNKQFFDIPQDWLDARPLTKIEFFDFNMNAWNPQNQLSTFTAVANTHTVNGNVIDYQRYTNNSSNRAEIRMRLIF